MIACVRGGRMPVKISQTNVSLISVQRHLRFTAYFKFTRSSSPVLSIFSLTPIVQRQ